MTDLIAIQKIAGWQKLKTLVLDSVSTPISEDEFAGLQRVFVGIGTRRAASFDRWMTNSVFEAEGFFLIRQSMTILAPDRADAGQAFVSFAGGLKHRFESPGVWR